MLYNTIKHTNNIQTQLISDYCLFFKITPSPPTKSLDFRGFDSSRLLILTGGNYHNKSNLIGSLPESLTQGLLVGKLLIGGLGVYETETYTYPPINIFSI